MDEKQADNFAQQQRLMDFVEELKASPIAINTADANEQHYEVPAAFYDLVLGNFSKYSSALYPPNTPVSKASELLDEAEQVPALRATARHCVFPLCFPIRWLARLPGRLPAARPCLVFSVRRCRPCSSCTPSAPG